MLSRMENDRRRARTGKINRRRIEENTESVSFGLLDGKQRGRYEVNEETADWDALGENKSVDFSAGSVITD